jgi:MoaA/NifB/PqqE/SkfB family radical SAM enzyme
MDLVSTMGFKCSGQKGFKVRSGPSGIHLFNRESGFNILIDEVIPPKASWTVAPRQVSIALTNSCDLACSYCFAPKTHHVLAFDTIASWIVELDANGSIGVGFGGGEPTLYRDFARLCSYAVAKTRLAVTFTTHGHHLDDALLLALKGKVHFIRVSMDGVNATYEKLRKRPFKYLRERMNAVRKIAPFGINYVVNSVTFPDLDAAVKIAESEGASEILLLPERQINGCGGIDMVTANALRNWVMRYSGAVRLAVSERDADGMPTCDPFKSESGLRAYAHISADGTLKHTSFENDGVRIGPGGIMVALNELQRTN